MHVEETKLIHEIYCAASQLNQLLSQAANQQIRVDIGTIDASTMEHRFPCRRLSVRCWAPL